MARPAPALIVLCWAALTACERPAERAPIAAEEGAPLRFVERAQELGVRFVHNDGGTGERYFLEALGGGVALFDYDRDGDVDLYFVDSGALEGNGAPRRDVLLRNDQTSAGPRFVDVTDAAQIRPIGYGTGTVTADFDNDGWVDLFLTSQGPNQLWRNTGAGSFELTYQQSRLETRWSTSAAAVDVNQDGLLDIYVTNYVDYRVDVHQPCYSELGAIDYCGPKAYSPTSDQMLINAGDGRFEDLSAQYGLLAHPGPGLGVATGDLDGDQRPEIFVANDQARNFLWVLEDETGLERALERGLAYNGLGIAEASMGVALGDVDRDGSLDVFVTHLLMESNTLYSNDGSGVFSDRSTSSGLGQPSLGLTGFGTALVDLDLDGWLDALTANGEVRIIEEQTDDQYGPPLKQPNQIFRSVEGRFEDVTATGAPQMLERRASRGLGTGDLDGDGDIDFLVTNLRAEARLFVNETDVPAWLGIDLQTAQGGPGLGAFIEAEAVDGLPLVRFVRTSGSYLSAHDPRIQLPPVDSFDAQWPGALKRLRIVAPASGHYLRIRRGAS